MIYLPSSPEIGGPKLAAYLAAPRRRAVFDNIRSRLGPVGRVDDLARYYIVSDDYRQRIFRKILLACRCRVPAWARMTDDATELNRAFMEAYEADRAGGSADGR